VYSDGDGRNFEVRESISRKKGFLLKEESTGETKLGRGETENPLCFQTSDAGMNKREGVQCIEEFPEQRIAKKAEGAERNTQGKRDRRHSEKEKKNEGLNKRRRE